MTSSYFSSVITEYNDKIYEQTMFIDNARRSIQSIRDDMRKIDEDLIAAKQIGSDEAINNCQQQIKLLSETQHELEEKIRKMEIEKGFTEQLLSNAKSELNKAIKGTSPNFNET